MYQFLGTLPRGYCDSNVEVHVGHVDNADAASREVAQRGPEPFARVLEGGRVASVLGVDVPGLVEQGLPRDAVVLEHQEAVVHTIQADLGAHVADDHSGVGLKADGVPDGHNKVVEAVTNLRKD